MLLSIGVLSAVSTHTSGSRFMAVVAPKPVFTSGAPHAGVKVLVFSVSVFQISTRPEAYTFSA